MLKKRLIQSPFFGYILAVLGVAMAVGIAVLIARFFTPGPALGLLFLAVILAAAWTGYGPGLVASAITFVVVPYFFRPRFRFSSIEFGNFALTIIVSVLMSSVAAGRKRVERQLRNINQQLESRIAERTSELQRAKQRLANILDSLTQAFFALDRNWRFLYANQMVAGAARLTKEEIVGRNIWELFPQARETEFHRAYSRVMDERVPVQFEAQYGDQWFDVHAFPTQEGLTAFAVDITERRQIQQKLMASHEQLAHVLESIRDGFIRFDREWRFLYLNQPAARLIRRSPENSIGHTIWEFFPDVIDTAAYRELQRAMTDRVPVHFELHYEPFEVWLENHAYPTPEGLALFSRDITVRKEGERVVARMASIVESSQDAIISKTLDGIVSTWNPAAERIYGYSAAEMIGRSMEMLLPPDRLTEEQDILDPARLGAESARHFETIRRRKDGTLIHISLTISPIRDERGTLIGISHISRDITKRVQLEEQLRETQKLESLGVLAGGVAHDFNNLLTGILGNASLALEEMKLDDPDRVALEEVVIAAERAADLTRQLLAYAGKGRFIIRLVDMSELVRQITNLLRTSIPKHVQLRLELASPLPPIEADISQMQQIIMNLVINGAEAIGDEPGTVLIQTGLQSVDEHYIATLDARGRQLHSGEYVALEVRDTGCGMDRETQAKIFDPFFTTKFAGRGLGLSAVLGIVNSHHGALKVYSAPGHGSTFKLLFPAASGSIGAPVEPAGRKDFSGSGLILVVDDEATVRTTARLALQHHGYTVFVAEDGQQAIDIFRERHAEIRLVLMDLTMPVMGGEEAVRHLKSLDPAIPVILSSGFNEVEAIQRFTGQGLAGFLQKPYTASTLAAKVKSVLSSGAQPLTLSADRGRPEM
jgi:PAS domain S-box-containing protein